MPLQTHSGVYTPRACWVIFAETVKTRGRSIYLLIYLSTHLIIYFPLEPCKFQKRKVTLHGTGAGAEIQCSLCLCFALFGRRI